VCACVCVWTAGSGLEGAQNDSLSFKRCRSLLALGGGGGVRQAGAAHVSRSCCDCTMLVGPTPRFRPPPSPMCHCPVRLHAPVHRCQEGIIFELEWSWHAIMGEPWVQVPWDPTLVSVCAVCSAPFYGFAACMNTRCFVHGHAAQTLHGNHRTSPPSTQPHTLWPTLSPATRVTYLFPHTPALLCALHSCALRTQRSACTTSCTTTACTTC
jgi:hypothetical protein